MDKSQKISALLVRIGLIQEAAIECRDFDTYFKWQKAALRLIGYKITLLKRDNAWK